MDSSWPKKQVDAAKHAGISITKFRKLEEEGHITRLPGGGAWYNEEGLGEWAPGGSDEHDNS